MDKNTARVRLESKSLGLGVVLTILFGGLGMFYLSIWWGLIGLFFEGLLWILTVISGGILGFFLAGWRILCVIITVISISNHNRRLINSLD